jgi:hypothetical protein
MQRSHGDDRSRGLRTERQGSVCADQRRTLLACRPLTSPPQRPSGALPKVATRSRRTCCDRWVARTGPSTPTLPSVPAVMPKGVRTCAFGLPDLLVGVFARKGGSAHARIAVRRRCLLSDALFRPSDAPVRPVPNSAPWASTSAKRPVTRSRSSSSPGSSSRPGAYWWPPEPLPGTDWSGNGNSTAPVAW